MARRPLEDAGGQGDPDHGFLRPAASVLAAGALVPAANLVEPPPDHFSHECTRNEPYRYGGDPSTPPDGELVMGTPVLVVADDGRHARVIDEHGLYVQVRSDSLRART